MVAAVVAATADSFDSSLLPSASSTYSLLIEIQEAEHKDLLVVEVGEMPSALLLHLENPIQNQGHKLELHKLMSLLVDQSKVVPEGFGLFLQNSKMDILHKNWHPQIQIQPHLTSILESSQLLQE